MRNVHTAINSGYMHRWQKGWGCEAATSPEFQGHTKGFNFYNKIFSSCQVISHLPLPCSDYM